jgi:hypothetical protein
MANETNETAATEVKDNGVAKKALKTANETAATLRKVIKRLEEVMGLDIDGDGKTGKAGHVKLTALIGVAVVFAALTGGLFAANELVWKVGDSAYVDAEGDATFNSVTAGTTNLSTASALTVTAGTTDTAIIIGADAAGAANTQLDTTGAGTITIGSADVTAITLTATDTTATGDITITGSDLTLGAAGVKLTGDGDGAITLLGLGNGSDEDLVINLDDTANTAVISSGTSLDRITLTAIGLTAANVSTGTGEATVDGKYAVVGGDATTGLMVQRKAITASAAALQTNAFDVAFGAAPIVVASYTEDPGDVRPLWVVSTSATNVIISVTADKNYAYVAVGARP